MASNPNARCSVGQTQMPETEAHTRDLFNEHLNKKAESNYAFFVECIKSALRVTFDAMVEEGIGIAILAQLSCVIYAGRHKLYAITKTL